jgi:glycosyltransferase involved in cell wall biosynthesis
MARGLTGHGIAVRTVAPRDPSLSDAPPADLDVELVDVPRRSSPRPAWERVRLPIAELAVPEFADRVLDLAHAADVVHLDQIEAAALAPLLRGRVPVAVHLHYRAARDAPMRLSELRPRMRRVLSERAALGSTGWLVANSEQVARTMRRRGRHVVVAPLPVDVAAYPPADHDGPLRVGILGTADWPPTRAAVDRLVRDVWPRVAAAVPGAELVVAGRGMADLLAGASVPSGVDVVGTVPSAAAFLRSLSVLAYPPRRGSGTKVKVLEALACGVPVVCTPPGAEGLEPTDGLLVAGDTDTIATHLCRLLRDPAERRQRGAAGRASIAQRHGPVAATASLVPLYERMLSARG